MIVVMGATGNTGSVVATRLLDRKAKVRVLGRNADRLAPLTRRGAEAAVADVTSADSLTPAFRGATAVYALVPPNYRSPDPLGHYRGVGDAIARAIEAAGVRRLVFLSSLGAELPSGTGPIQGLHAVEERLRNVPGLDLLILRPSYFFENHFGSLGLIKAQGVNGGALAPDAAFPQVAAEDIGAAAADALGAGDFSGVSVHELLGPRDLSPAEATRIIGKAIGKPDLAYVQFPDEGFIAGMEQAGFGRPTAELFVEMSRALSGGRVRSLEGRNARNTTPTTFEAFVEKKLAPAYRGQANET